MEWRPKTKRRRRTPRTRSAISAGVALLLVSIMLAAGRGGAEPADDRALWAELYADWQRAVQDAEGAAAAMAPVHLACVRAESDLARLSGDPVRHGRLARDDFRADAPASAALQVEVPGGEIGAQVGIALVCIGEPRLVTQPDGRIEARMEDVRFVAVLDRARSWWNPRSDDAAGAVLRHEQCHFDLAEAFARQLSARADTLAGAAVASGESATEAARALAARWKSRLGAVAGELNALESRYDRETAHGTIPEAQAAWQGRCERELAESAAHAR
jgi:hypothetical protein